MNTKYPVALPRTDFPIKSNKNQEILDLWKKIDLYKKLNERKSNSSAGGVDSTQTIKNKTFLLHDGPPFANGSPHMGHAVNKIMKDVFNRGKAMLGYSIDYVPGWDCHGLPIEAAVEKTMAKSGETRAQISIGDFREKCKNFALQWIDVQKQGFEQMGVIGDFDNPYTTIKSQLDILKEFHKFVDSDDIYRDLRPIMWSCAERTALAEAEVEYMDKKSNAIDVKFEIVGCKQDTSHENNVNADNKLIGCKVVIWTTTPWTMPANRGVAYGQDFEYVIMQIDDQNNVDGDLQNNEKLIVAKSLLDDFCKRAKVEKYSIVHEFTGNELANHYCLHPLYGAGIELKVPLIESDHVSLEQGTGLVHIAPSHGEEDFVLGKKYSLEVPNLVKGNGRYIDELPLVGGQHIFDSESVIIEKLRELSVLAAHAEIIHSYPHSWRSRTPLIYRATPQWFIKVDKLKEHVLQAVDNVNWIPQFGKTRFVSMLEKRGDWCVSRQRVWGVPLAIIYHEKTGEIAKDALPKIQSKLAKLGVGAWWEVANEILQEYPDHEAAYDILDVWFESGASQSYVLDGKVADVYFEGSDQHRGWFQSSALQASRLEPKMPYKNLITHGFVVDKKGRKMSKSLGNGVDPMEIIDKHGSDLIRLWIATQDYTEDLKWSQEHLSRVQDIEKKFRNTIKYLIGSIQHGASGNYSDLPLLEKWVLHKLNDLNIEFKQAVDNFTTYKFMKSLSSFCTVDLSAFYFDIRKDTLYCDQINETLPQQVRMVMCHVLEYLLKWLAPIMSFATEEAWQSIRKIEQIDTNSSFINNRHKYESIHLQMIDELDLVKEAQNSSSIGSDNLNNMSINNWHDSEIQAQMTRIREVRKVVTSALEIMREKKEINSSLEAEVHIVCDLKATSNNNINIIEHMREICIVSDLYVYNNEQEMLKQLQADQSKSLNNENADESNIFTLQGVENVGVLCRKRAGDKCPRCKRVYDKIVKSSEDQDEIANEICSRCYKVVNSLK